MDEFSRNGTLTDLFQGCKRFLSRNRSIVLDRGIRNLYQNQVTLALILNSIAEKVHLFLQCSVEAPHSLPLRSTKNKNKRSILTELK